jgi:N-acetylglucosamine-6-phosphate deacetylase
MKQSIFGRNPNDGQPIEVIVDDGRVQAIVPARTDQDAWLTPGVIDLQVNGYGGDDVNADGIDPGVIHSLTKKMITTGVTTYLPTIITASEGKITAALRAIAEARRGSALVADAIPYIHVEGPNISPVDGYRGAHAREHVRPPSMAEFARWQQASGGLVRMVTLSPHWEGAEEYISALTRDGVYVAIGHTDAIPEQIRRAVDADATLSTHLGNGCAGMMHRHANSLWSQLADDRLTATLIADGHHLPGDMLKSIVRAKGAARCILISDASAVAGLPPGRYKTPVGGDVELHKNGRLSLAGTEFLAGAALCLKDGILRAVSCGGISLAEGLGMATANPGRFVGNVGILRPGAAADLIQFTVDLGSNKLNIERIWIKGVEWSGA